MENGAGEQGDTLDAMSDRIGEAVFGPSSAEPASEPAASPTPDATPAELAALEVPKSWPQEMHEHWGTTPRKVQEYWQTREKQMLDGLEQYKIRAQLAQEFEKTVNPFQNTLKQLGLSPMQAAQSLFNADHRLRYSSPEEKIELAKTFLKNYGIDLGAVTGQPSTPAQQVDPVVKQLQERQQVLESALVAQQQASLNEARAKATKEVEVFASDAKAHPYFDYVADDIAAFVQQGKSLQDAYDMAVWANPVTRAKELARVQTEAEAKLKENARLEALPKKRAAGVNVRGSDAARTPTEPVGTLEETIRDGLRSIRARVS
jgi:hypothetical protein